MQKKIVYRCYRCEVWFYEAVKCPCCGSLDIGLSNEITVRLKALEKIQYCLPLFSVQQNVVLNCRKRLKNLGSVEAVNR
jgi:hypothetical protein